MSLQREPAGRVGVHNGRISGRRRYRSKKLGQIVRRRVAVAQKEHALSGLGLQRGSPKEDHKSSEKAQKRT